jgi:hypothetical protein
MPTSSIQGDSVKKLNCILVKKNGTLNQLPPTEMTRESYIAHTETSESYKDSFRMHTTWNVSKYKVSIELWARSNGRAGQENKYEFPPPVDEVLFFGSCLLVMVDSPPHFSFTLDAWKKIYSTLFGGFHDLSKTVNADETEYDEMEDVPQKHKTRDGYLKDGFIVEDSIQSASGLSISKKMKIKTKDNPKSKKNTCSTSTLNTYNIPPIALSEPPHNEEELEAEPYIDN